MSVVREETKALVFIIYKGLDAKHHFSIFFPFFHQDQPRNHFLLKTSEPQFSSTISSPTHLLFVKDIRLSEPFLILIHAT